MKAALMIFAAIGVACLDITAVVVTFWWICRAVSIGENQGAALIIMWFWFIGGLTTSAIGIAASEEE